MHEMAVDVDDAGAILVIVHHVIVENLVVKRLGHEREIHCFRVSVPK